MNRALIILIVILSGCTAKKLVIAGKDTMPQNTLSVQPYFRVDSVGTFYMYVHPNKWYKMELKEVKLDTMAKYNEKSSGLITHF